MNANTNNLKCGICGETDEDYWTRDGVAHCEKCNTKWCEKWTAEDEAEEEEADTKKANDITLAFIAETCPKMLPAFLMAFDPTLTEKQRNRITRIRAERKDKADRAEAERALANPSNLVELSSYAVLKETLRIDAERQEVLKAILQLCRTEGEVEVPAVCYECGFEGKCLVVEGDDSDWLCLDCSCIS